MGTMPAIHFLFSSSLFHFSCLLNISRLLFVKHKGKPHHIFNGRTLLALARIWIMRRKNARFSKCPGFLGLALPTAACPGALGAGIKPSHRATQWFPSLYLGSVGRETIPSQASASHYNGFWKMFWLLWSPFHSHAINSAWGDILF